MICERPQKEKRAVMGRLEGKVAIVTGSARGFGKAMALNFAKEGADIVVSDLLASEMEQTAAGVRSLGRKAIAVKTDVTKKDQVRRMVSSALEAFGKVDILVNNAGIQRHRDLLEMSEEDWDAVLAVNLKGPFLNIQAIAPHMIERKYGKIINIASVAGLGTSNMEMANYASSKAGLIQLTKVAARRLGPHGVNVNCIAPGFVVTDITFVNRTEEEVKRIIEYRTRNAVLGKAGKPEDIANLALFLASDESSFITGQVILCDGGRVDRW